MKRILLVAAVTASMCINVASQQNDPQTRDLIHALKSQGNFSVLLDLLSRAKLTDTTFNSGQQITLLAPNDAAFAKLPKGVLDGVRQDPGKLRTLLLSHILPGNIQINDMLVPDPKVEGNTLLELKSVSGSMVSILCNLHTGEHHPRINAGSARIGKGDILFSDGVVHEIDTVLIMDTSRQ